MSSRRKLNTWTSNAITCRDSHGPRGPAQTLRRGGEKTPGPANCRQELELHVHKEAQSTPLYLTPSDNVPVTRKAITLEDVFQEQVLHFNVTLYIGFPVDFLRIPFPVQRTLSALWVSPRFTKSFPLCGGNTGTSEPSQYWFLLSPLEHNPLRLPRNQASSASWKT